MISYIPVLSIAGSDPSGGAGLQADIKTMSALGAYAMAAVTAVTVQNTLGVSAVGGVSPQVVAGQVDAVFADIPPRAVKVGMLFDAATATAVADALERNRARSVVLDPVMISTSGSRLLAEDAVEVVVSRLLPMAEVVTPNAMEAEALTGTSDPELQIARLRRLGANAILVKGGDSDTDSPVVVDRLNVPGSGTTLLRSPRVATVNTHGTGCTLSSAIATYLAMGCKVAEAVARAHDYVARAIASGADVAIGHGHGPVNHLFSPRPLTVVNN